VQIIGGGIKKMKDYHPTKEAIKKAVEKLNNGVYVSPERLYKMSEEVIRCTNKHDATGILTTAKVFYRNDTEIRCDFMPDFIQYICLECGKYWFKHCEELNKQRDEEE
jgi:hypothetical protein